MKVAKTKSLVFIGVLILVTGVCKAQRSVVYDSTYVPAIEAVRKSIPTFMKENQIPGLSITISKDGNLIWTEGFGVLNSETKAPVTVNSMFRVGSVFKSVTALALLKLVSQGKLNLDDPISKFIPELPKQYKRVTVRQLATHTAGVRHYRQVDEFYAGIRKYGSMAASLENNPEFKAEILSNVDYKSVSESLEPFINDKLLFKPGARYQYSTYGYVLLGAVLEKAAGQSFNEYVKREILAPLEMNHTKPDMNDDRDPQKATPYMFTDRLIPLPQVNLSNKWSGGGYVSSSLDITKFANSVRDFIPSNLYDEMIKPTVLKNGDTRDYGIGWKLANESSGGTALYHDGFTPGGSAVLIMFTELTICIATNQTTVVSPQHAADIGIPFFELSRK